MFNTKIYTIMKTQNATLRGLVATYKKHAPRKNGSSQERIIRYYADELFSNLMERYKYDRKSANEPFYKWYMNSGVWKNLRKFLLNGAETWSQYSWGGNSLVYNWDIAEVVLRTKTAKRAFGFNPERGELKRTEITRYGREIHLLDVQAEYLRRAYFRVRDIITIWDLFKLNK